MGRYNVSKAIITVSGSDHYVMSYKGVVGSGYGKLEFLGGRHEPDETPLEALVRELGEEEPTGKLSDLVHKRAPHFHIVETEKANHYLFPVTVSQGQFSKLAFCEIESLGLDLVPHHQLRPSPRFTKKTNLLIDVLRSRDPKGLLVA